MISESRLYRDLDCPCAKANRVYGDHTMLKDPRFAADFCHISLMNQPTKNIKRARKLSELVAKEFSEAFAKQGFVSTDLVMRWREIVCEELAMQCEPLKIQWPQSTRAPNPEPATLILRVDPRSC